MLRYSAEEENLASEATEHYEKEEYEACITAMRKLSQSRNSDPKVIMNKALVEFYHRHNLTRADEYLCQLENAAMLAGSPITDMSERSPTEDLQESQTVDESRSPQTTSQLALLRHPAAICAHYNYAVVLFYQRQFIHSELLLAGLLGLPALTLGSALIREQAQSLPRDVQLIDFPISAGSLLCQRIVLLWLETLLALQQSQYVVEVTGAWLHSIECASGKKASNPSSPIDTPVFERIGSKLLDSCSFSPQTIDMLSGIQQPLSLFRIHACLLTGRLAFARRELSQSKPTANLAVDACEHSPSVDLDAITPSTRSSKTPKPTDSHTWDTSRSSIFLSAHLSYLQSEYIECLRLLNAIPLSLPPSVWRQWETIMVWNNLGVLHMRMGKFAVCGLHQRRALRETEALTSSLGCKSSALSGTFHASSPGHSLHDNPTQLIRQTPLHAFSMSQHHALLYNSGLQLLFSRRPASAFSALLAVLQVYPRNPRLWFRLAECCIKSQRSNNLSDWNLDARANCLVNSVGTGPTRKLIIGPGTQEHAKPWVESASMSSPTLEFASLCLRNALLLLPRPPARLVSSSETESTECDVETSRSALIHWANQQSVCTMLACSSAPLSGLGLLHLISSVLLSSAYVSLCLHNPLASLYSAEQVLRTGPPPSLTSAAREGGAAASRTSSAETTSSPSGKSTCLPGIYGWIGLVSPPAYRYLAKMYLAEAYLLLDNLPDACSSLLMEDFMGQEESISILSLHSLEANCSAYRGRACLAPSFLLPQTHPLCGAVATTGQDQATLLPGQSATRPPDFPVTLAQAVGILLYNLGVCCALRDDYSMARQLLENAAPSLLAISHRSWDPCKIYVTHGSEQHKSLLYPEPTRAKSLSSDQECSLPIGLGVRFQHLWLYLDLCEGRHMSALNFVQHHAGHVAYAGCLTDPSLLRSFARSSGLIVDAGPFEVSELLPGISTGVTIQKDTSNVVPVSDQHISSVVSDSLERSELTPVQVIQKLAALNRQARSTGLHIQDPPPVLPKPVRLEWANQPLTQQHAFQNLLHPLRHWNLPTSTTSSAHFDDLEP